MSSPHYERLSGLDSSFLMLESPHAHMHIALTAIFEPGSLGTGAGGVDTVAIRRLIASRLHLLPRYRQRLSRIPLVEEPIWIDDDRFDLDYHVRHTRLPRPGTEEQLRGHCSRILERHLDRSRPLWEIWLIEGLERGRFAMLTKVHHCMVDGVGGVQLLAAILAPEPGAEPQPPLPWTPRPAPDDRAIVRHELARRAGSALDLVAGLGRSIVRPAPTAATAREHAAGVLRLARTGLAGAPVEPFNAKIGPHRRVDWSAASLADVRSVKKAMGATVNDVVLATVAGAVRRFLAGRAVDVDRVTFKAAVPVSVRTPGAVDATGNRVAAWIVPLPVGEGDALRRLTLVRDKTLELKREHQAEATQALTEVAEWTGSNVLGLALKFLYRSRPYNIIVTNVPGPPVPVYLGDARMVVAYPHLPLFEGQALGIALFSYAGTIAWGLGADWDAVPDLGDFRGAIEAAFAELCGLTAGASSAARERAA